MKGSRLGQIINLLTDAKPWGKRGSCSRPVSLRSYHRDGQILKITPVPGN
jgi:hypothetical protein